MRTKTEGSKPKAPVVSIAARKQPAAPAVQPGIAEDLTIRQDELNTLISLRRVLRANRKHRNMLVAGIRKRLLQNAQVEEGARCCYLEKYQAHGQELTRLFVE